MAVKQDITVPASGKALSSTAWTPRTVRCARCGDLAREEVRERVSETEVAIRYGCPHCRWRQTRHYHENEA